MSFHAQGRLLTRVWFPRSDRELAGPAPLPSGSGQSLARKGSRGPSVVGRRSASATTETGFPPAPMSSLVGMVGISNDWAPRPACRRRALAYKGNCMLMVSLVDILAFDIIPQQQTGGGGPYSRWSHGGPAVPLLSPRVVASSPELRQSLASGRTAKRQLTRCFRRSSG